MADQASKDAAAKERIIKHLNTDHQRSLSYYLQHFNSLSSFEARSPTLVDITFNALTFRTASGNMSTIPLYPPMTSWSEARIRTVEMDRDARAALNISSIVVTEYEAPRGILQITIFVLCVLTLILFITRPWIVPGTWVYDKVLKWYPGGPEWCLWIAKVIALPVVGIHAVEAYLLATTRLRKYNVEAGSSLWRKWVASCALEGFGAFQRIDAIVKKKEEEAAKAKH
jgi:hypothetical protein